MGRRTIYQVKWEGYNSDQNTWEPLSNLRNVKHLVKEYNDKVDGNLLVDTLQEESTCSNLHN